jgi:hypothetical protein
MSGYEDFVKAQRNVNAKLEQLRSANDRYDAASHRESPLLTALFW